MYWGLFWGPLFLETAISQSGTMNGQMVEGPTVRNVGMFRPAAIARTALAPDSISGLQAQFLQ